MKPVSREGYKYRQDICVPCYQTNRDAAMRPAAIMDLAQEIGTYETSIEPYEDCCTVFLPKHPATKPKLERILESESLLDSEALIEEAMMTLETVSIGADR